MKFDQLTLTDLKDLEGQIPSLAGFPSRLLAETYDEFEQVLDSIVFGKLNRKGRASKLNALKSLLCGADRVFLASATGNPEAVGLIQKLTGFESISVGLQANHNFSKPSVTIHRGQEGRRGSASMAKAESG